MGEKRTLTRRTSLTALSVALGGCSGLIGGSQSNDDDTSTSSATPTKTPPSTVSGRVPQSRYDAGRTGRVRSPGPRRTLREAWTATPTYEADDGNRYEVGVGSQPAIADGTLFLGMQDGLHAIDAVTGETRWSDGGTAGTGFTPAIEGDRIYHLSRQGALEARTLDGYLIWRFMPFEREDGGFPGSSGIAVHDGRVFAGIRNDLFALDADTGAVEWRATGPNRIKGTGVSASDGTVYNVRLGGYLFAVDAATGEVNWWYQPDFGPENPFQSSTFTRAPAVRDGTVYGIVSRGDVYAVDAATGRERWRVRIEGNFDRAQRYSSPLVAAETVYVAGSTGTVLALDAEDGRERWRYEPGEDILYNASPIMANGTVYAIGSQGSVAAITTDGDVEWRVGRRRWNMRGAPTILDGHLYLPMGGNGLMCLR